MRHLPTCLMLAALVGLSGCDEPAAPGAPASAPLASAPMPSAPVPGAPQPGVAPPAEASPTRSQTQGADQGLGKKGQGYGGGMITEPVRQYWRLQERIVFDIQIPDGMNKFRALNDRYPKDLAEFKREILEPASITLPELYADEKYVYDPKAGEILIEHPAGQPAEETKQ